MIHPITSFFTSGCNKFAHGGDKNCHSPLKKFGESKEIYF